MDELILNNVDALTGYIPNFLFILLRVTVFISFLPVLGGNQTPVQFRLGLAVFISMLLTPVVQFEIAENHIPMMVVKEIFIAMALGLTVRFIFLAINMAGAFISQTIGMSIATTFNPEIGQSTQIAETYGTLALLYFLILDVHHDLIFVFVKSFELLPAGDVNILAIVPKMLSMGSKLFTLAIKISAPIVVGALITYLLSGFLYKAAPQLNIFFIVMPLNIFLGFVLMVMTIPVFQHILGIEYEGVTNEMLRIISLAKG